jgi:hypothetical protein
MVKINDNISPELPELPELPALQELPESLNSEIVKHDVKLSDTEIKGKKAIEVETDKPISIILVNNGKKFGYVVSDNCVLSGDAIIKPKNQEDIFIKSGSPTDEKFAYRNEAVGDLYFLKIQVGNGNFEEIVTDITDLNALNKALEEYSIHCYRAEEGVLSAESSYNFRINNKDNKVFISHQDTNAIVEGISTISINQGSISIEAHNKEGTVCYILAIVS